MCTGAVNLEYFSGWAMLAPNSNPGFGQSGYDYTRGDQPWPRDFAEDYIGHGGCCTDMNFTNTQVFTGASYKYITVVDQSAHRIKMYEEGTSLLLTSTLDPNAAGNWGTSHRGAYFSGEVGHTQDDMIGNSSANANSVLSAARCHSKLAQHRRKRMGGFSALTPDNSQWKFTGVKSSCVNGPWCFGIWDSDFSH